MNICSASLRSIISLSLSSAEPPMVFRLRQVSQSYSPQTNIMGGQSVPRASHKKKNSLFWDWDLTWVRTIDWVCLRICNTSCFLGSKKLECEINDKTLGFLCLPTRTWSWQTGVHPVLFLLTRLASVFRGRLPRLCVKPANEERLEVEEQQFWGWERRRDGSPRVYRIVGRRM
jgi:hypothetical protein